MTDSEDDIVIDHKPLKKKEKILLKASKSVVSAIQEERKPEIIKVKIVEDSSLPTKYERVEKKEFKNILGKQPPRFPEFRPPDTSSEPEQIINFSSTISKGGMSKIESPLILKQSSPPSNTTVAKNIPPQNFTSNIPKPASPNLIPSESLEKRIENPPKFINEPNKNPEVRPIFDQAKVVVQAQNSRITVQPFSGSTSTSSPINLSALKPIMKDTPEYPPKLNSKDSEYLTSIEFPSSQVAINKTINSVFASMDFKSTASSQSQFSLTTKIVPSANQAMMAGFLDGKTSKVPGQNLSLAPNPNLPVINKMVSLPRKNPQQVPSIIPRSKPQKIVKIPKENLLIKLSTVIEKLTQVIDFNKILEDKAEFQEKFSKYSDSYFDEGKKVLELIQHKLNCCDVCRANPPVCELICDHMICEYCLNYKLKINQPNTEDCFYSCPVCLAKITQGELARLVKHDASRLLEIERFALQRNLAEYETLRCAKCNQMIKGFYENSCLHMCKDCTSASIRASNFQCIKCFQGFSDLKSILNEIILCQKCKDPVYFVGDSVREIHEGCMLCQNCIYHSFNQGICEFCNKRLTKVEKLKINDHIFAFCAACNKEVHRQCLKVRSCCKSMECDECFNGCAECTTCKRSIP